MRLPSTVLIVGLVLGTTLSVSHAQQLSSSLQSKVQKIAKNIDSVRQKLAREGTAAIADDFKAKQLRDRIQSYGNGLAKMPSKDDPVLMAAKQAHASLVAEYNALASGSASASQQSTQQSSQQSTQQGSQQSTQQSTQQAPSGSTTQQATNNDAVGAAAGAQLVSGQRVRVKKLTRDMASLRSGIVNTGPSALQNNAEVKRYQQALEKYASQLRRYADYQTDPDVITAAKEYQALRSALSAEYQRAQAQISELGDVQGILAGIEASLQRSIVPKMLWKPFGDQEAAQFVSTIAATKSTAEAAIAEIQRIAPTAKLETNNPGTVQQGAPYDRNDMNRLLRWATDNINQSDAALALTQQQLNNEFQMQDQHELEYFRGLDPDVPKYRMNAFLKEGAEAEIYSRLDKQLGLPTSMAALQRAVNGQVTSEVQARIDEIRQIRKSYAEDRVRAVGESRLPEPVSNDAQRIQAAKQILAVPRYEFGEHGPVILTTEDIVTRTKTVSRDEIKDVDISLSGEITWSGTRETWEYEWDEFKFATPLKNDNGDWYIWWITAKYFRSGASTTPINTWVSGAATQGDLILEQNFR